MEPKEKTLEASIDAENDARRKMYDASAAFYSLTFPLIWRFGFPSLHRWAESGLAGSVDVLDAGTGTGYWAGRIAEWDSERRVVGVDFSQEYLRRAERAVTMPNVEFVKADIQNMPFEDGRFDAIFCCGVLDTFPDVSRVLTEFRRTLKDDGKLFLVLRGKPGPFSRLSEFLFRIYVGTTRYLKERSTSAFHVPEKLWNREPLAQRLAGLAAGCDLEVTEFKQGRAVTAAIVSPVN